MAKRSKSRQRLQHQPHSAPAASPRQHHLPPVGLDQLWQRVRSGAANVAGVRYQLAVTAYLLAVARQSPGISELAPEGLEDIDCELADGATLHVQTKDRAAGVGRFGPAELRAAVAHAAPALSLDARARLVVITDAQLTGGLTETGFDHSVAALAPAVAVAAANPGAAHQAIDLPAFLGRTHLVRLEWGEVHHQTRQHLAEQYQLRPAVAALAYAVLLDEVSGAAADQRHTTPATARRFLPNDLDVLIHRLRQLVDLDQLERAEREGLVEPLDFTRPLDLPLDRFLLGIDVEPGHIAAGLDVLRADEIAAVFAGLHRDRYILIAGPSGAGKSALLWRAAHELGGRFRLLRLRRLASQDVPELMRYIEAQRPSPQAPILVCGDNLGRPALAAWEEAVDRLLEMPGVHIVGAVREEDFRASLGRGRAQVVRPLLTDRLAAEIAAQLSARGVPLLLEPGEALARATGLLMEFVALLVSGRRLEDIVTAQVEERFVADREVEREILRYVAAAHVYTVDLPALALASLVPAPAALPAALHRLEAEFLVRRAEGDRWRGLHELRSRVVTKRLHELPPPTEAQSLARLLPTVGPRDRRTLVTGAALAGLDLAVLATTAGEILAATGPDAATVFTLLDAFLEAEEVPHARACLDFVRRCVPEFDAAAILPILQGLREKWLQPFSGLPNGDLLDALAAAIPERPPSLAAELAARMPDKVLTATLTESPLASAIDLLELLVFLGRSIPLYTAAALIGNARAAGEVAHTTRAVAALAQATPAGLPQLDRLAGSLESRLDAIAEFRRDILRWEASGSGAFRTVTVAAAEQGEGTLNDRLVAVCRLIYDACPEVEQVHVQALATDGSPSTLLDSKKSPGRRHLPNPIRQIRRNLAFQDALGRLTAAGSWSARLRHQEALVRDLAELLAQVIPRLLDPHDNAARRRGWCEAVERARQSANLLPAAPLAPSSAVMPSDPAKRILDELAQALSQLARAVAGNRFENLLGTGSQLQGTWDKIIAGSEPTAVPLAEARDWPIVRRLLSQLVDLCDVLALAASLLLALHHDRDLLQRVTRRGTETWRDAALRIIGDIRDAILQQERQALVTALRDIPHELKLLARPGPGPVCLVTDVWLVVHASDHLPAVDKQLSALPDDLYPTLALRTYAVATAGGLVTLGGMRRLGYSRRSERTLNSVPWAATKALAGEAGVPLLASRDIDEVLRVGRLVDSATQAVAHYQLRDPRFSREPERQAALAAIERAQTEIVSVEPLAARNALQDALFLLEADPAIAGPAAVTPAAASGATVPAKLHEALTAAILDALVKHVIAGHQPPAPAPPRQGLETA